MTIEHQICQAISQSFSSLFGATVEAEKISLQPTRKDFEGTFTLVTFPFLALSKQKPEETGRLIGEYLKANAEVVTDFNVVKGFLNLVIAEQQWVQTLQNIAQDAHFGQFAPNGQKVMVEYSSPNTNKPLHLGHLRNNFLGFSVAQIMAANGYDVMMVNLVNDRGIHICKSMLAYQMAGKNEMPSDSEKGDKLVGRYYVEFDKALRAESKPLLDKVYARDLDIFEPSVQKNLSDWLERLDKVQADLAAAEDGKKRDIEKKISAIQDDIKQAVSNTTKLMEAAREMLKKWENGDTDTVALWNKMNNWVYAGFDVSYQTIGVHFDKMYKESETYLLGKDIVEEGLQKGVFFRKEDGSVWIDLTANGLDEKLVLRGDGTSVYITQDLGTADLKFGDFPMNKSVYVVGNEQDYHFKVLKLIMQKLGRSYADGIYHLSYGMVDLPSGKMKSREGTVVDADDLVAEMMATAKERTAELGKIDDFSTQEAEILYRQLALGALKYYLLKVDPKKRMLFNPAESIDFQGNTGVYIQFTHARICAIVRKAQLEGIAFTNHDFSSLASLEPSESDIVAKLAEYPVKVHEAAEAYAPSVIANYAYDLAKLYSRFYTELPIFTEPDPIRVAFRVLLSQQVARIIQKGMHLLGVEVPERM